MSGYGCIYIPQEIKPLGIEIWNSGFITSGATYEQWLSFVELPARYMPVAMYIDKTRRQWVMLVRSENLPALVPEGKSSLLAVEFVPARNGCVRVTGKKR